MKKSIFAALLCLALAAGLCACGGTSAPAEEEAAEEATAEAVVEEATEEETEESGEPSEAETAGDGHDADAIAEIDGTTITISNEWTGEDAENDVMTKTAVMTNYLFEYVQQCGPMELCVNGIELSDITFKDEDTADLAGVSVGSEAGLVALHITAENTSEDDVSFYPDQSYLITDTKEQLDCAVFLSDSVGGDFFGQVKKEGYVYFFCRNTMAEDLSHLQWRIDPPTDENFDDLGEPITIEFDLVEK